MTKPNPFNRRIYNRPAALFKDAAEIMRHRKRFNRKYEADVTRLEDAEGELAKLESGGDGTIIRKHGGTMPYQEILGAILEGKLYQTRARNFDNVLRRTLSTSDSIKRVGRGVYAVD